MRTHDHMGISAAHAKSADSPEAPWARPQPGLGVDIEWRLLPVDIVASLFTVQARWNDTVTDGLNQGDQAYQARSGKGVTEIGLTGGERAGIPLETAMTA